MLVVLFQMVDFLVLGLWIFQIMASLAQIIVKVYPPSELEIADPRLPRGSEDLLGRLRLGLDGR